MEANIEYPESMPEIAQILKSVMENSASKYCKKVPIPAECSIGKFWIH